MLRLLQGEMNAMFLRHEGFLGAVGAFLKVHPMTLRGSSSREQSKVRSRFVERFSMGAPFAGKYLGHAGLGLVLRGPHCFGS